MNLAVSNIVPLHENVCRKCKTSKAVSEFSLGRKGKLHSVCKSCDSQRHRKNVMENPEYWRNANYKKQYGVTLDQFRIMVSDQMGMCGNRACSTPIMVDGPQQGNKNKACLDHDHATGKIRGVLCPSCNIALGWMEQKSRVLGLAEYLDKHSTSVRS